MSDLDLGLFPARPDPEAPKPPRQPRSRTRWLRDGFALVVTVVLIGVLVHIVNVGKADLVDNFSSTRDYKGSGTGSQIVQVTEKATLKQVGNAMAKVHVVRSSGAFTKAWAEQSKLAKVPSGYYQLREHMSAGSAVTLLLDPASKMRTKVTLPEGTPLTKSLALIAKGTSLAPADLTKAAGNPAAIDLPAWANAPASLEGFLFPATYQFDPRADAVAAMQQMVAKFSDVAYGDDLQDSKEKVHHSPYEVLTIASIIEKEAGTKADYPKVARVVYNRLAKHMKLQLDSTINYVLPQRKGHLSQTDLEIESPYNTYQHIGLPPTPIDSPGEESIKAALAPADGNWLFFITVDKQGHTVFTHDYGEFSGLKAKAKADGVIQ